MTTTTTLSPTEQALAIISAEPAVEAFKPSGYDGKPARSITYSWVVGEATPRSPGGEPGQVLLELSVSHSTERKRLTASLGRVIERREGVFVSREYRLFSGVALPSQPIARYSSKALTEYAAATLASLPGYVESHEEVLNVVLHGERKPKTEEG